jgi:tetratricopeptide (TPR) repeat protein
MVDKSKDFLSETASLRTLSFPVSAQVDWGFRVGLGLLVLFAAAEISSVAYYYAGRVHMAHRGTTAPPPAQVATPARAVPSAAPSASTAVAVAPTVAPAPSAAAATPVISPAGRLLEAATALRERGDTTTALAKLHEAEQIDPNNAQVLAEMAGTYESMQLYDRSNETWRKIEQIGPSAGSLYELAENKLKLGASAPAVANAAAAVTPVAPPAEETAAATAHPGGEGITEGAVLGIGDISVTETPDNDADTNLTVRIPIKARTGTVIDHTKVTIRVYFYDTVGEDPKPVLTDAQTNFEWLTPNHDWASPNPEVLAVNYFRPKNQVTSSEAALSAAAAAVVPGKKSRTGGKPAGAGGNRHYLGYIVRIYYNDKLQAQRAQPSQLLSLFPAPASS